jgi:hypothetical protein
MLAACASDEPASPGGFDASTGRVVVTILGDEFALLDGVRMPLDAVVLQLRLKVRAMTKEQLKGFVVKVVVGKDVPESAAKAVFETRRRLLDALLVMDVRQVEYS